MENIELVDNLMMELMERTEKTVNVLKNDFQAVRAGRANPHVLDKVTFDYYGTLTPISQASNISVPDARCIVISPWDVSNLKAIEKAILNSNIGLNPTNDGKVIRLVVPELTEERRKDLAKQIKKMSEDSKVAIRNIRRDSMDTLKKAKTDKKITEDELAFNEKEVDKIVAKSIEVIEKVYLDKEKDILSV